MSGTFYGQPFFGGGFFGQLPAGASRSRQRFIARVDGEEFDFTNVDDLERFVEEVTKRPEPKAEKKAKARTKLRVEVQPEFQDELYSYDLPNIQPYFDRQAFDEVQRLLARFEMLKAQRFDDDEEAILLLL